MEKYTQKALRAIVFNHSNYQNFGKLGTTDASSTAWLTLNPWDNKNVTKLRDGFSFDFITDRHFEKDRII